jgi:hypothetical protein
MGAKYEDAVDPINIRINTLRIVNDSAVNPRSALQNATSDFNQAVASAQLRGSRLVALLNDPNVVYKASEEELFKVRANVNRITKSAQSVTGAIDRSLVEIITSRTGPRGRHVDGLLEYFKAEIDDIAREKLDKIDDRLESEWRTVEECYNQAMDPSGSLYPKLYSLKLSRDDSYWTYQSNHSGFNNMDSRTRVPNQYLTPEQRAELDGKRETEIRSDWNNFWIRTLNECLSGPTLFHPQGASPSATIHRSFEDVPRYLFRVYDSKSLGLNSDTVFASDHSFVPYGALAPKVDLRSLDDLRASDMLYDHLERKNCFNGSRLSSNGELRDNLVSWTSSLMNAIQYAIWRSHVGHTPASSVHICAVDTRKFPHGQFARDMWLLQSYVHPKSNWLRLENPEYDNGEYLSQGTIHHGGRSCVFSLQDLISSGIYKLYPEFAEQSAKNPWTNRVLQLRSIWREECQTSGEEFRQACEIARGPMKELDAWDAVLLLLSFRKRHSHWSCKSSNPRLLYSLRI